MPINKCYLKMQHILIHYLSVFRAVPLSHSHRSIMMPLLLLALSLNIAASSVAPPSQHPAPGADTYPEQTLQSPDFKDREQPSSVYRKPQPPSFVIEEAMPPLSRDREASAVNQDTARPTSGEEVLDRPMSVYGDAAPPVPGYEESLAPPSEYDESGPRSSEDQITEFGTSERHNNDESESGAGSRPSNQKIPALVIDGR